MGGATIVAFSPHCNHDAGGEAYNYSEKGSVDLGCILKRAFRCGGRQKSSNLEIGVGTTQSTK
jgi:hypothetical protein